MYNTLYSGQGCVTVFPFFCLLGCGHRCPIIYAWYDKATGVQRGLAMPAQRAGARRILRIPKSLTHVVYHFGYVNRVQRSLGIRVCTDAVSTAHVCDGRFIGSFTGICIPLAVLTRGPSGTIIPNASNIIYNIQHNTYTQHKICSAA
ncbi:pE146L [African swine fever virus]|uniref:PE146L n=1 Tax=African swine fever virus TaxID=10497 RepID=A0A894KR51_ASF|nr:pE146L [African swine fever virus]